MTRANVQQATERGNLMAKLLLGVTGSVAAIHTPALFEALRQVGHEVKVVATRSSLYFFDPAAIGRIEESRDSEKAGGGLVSFLDTGRRIAHRVILDEDEWPGRSQGHRYQRGDPVLHIELRRWADLLLIAPLDANTLAKLASGLADNCLTCVWRAWDVTKPVVLAPAMNTHMWEHPITGRNLRQIAGDLPPAETGLEDVIKWINVHSKTLHIVSPISKRLACGDEGIGAMGSLAEILMAVEHVLGK